MALVAREEAVTVVIVNYNTRAALARCLSSLDSRLEVIVVDNDSTDGSVEMVRERFPSVKVIANESNRGFGAANNQGIEAATRPLLLLLNSDAWATEGAVATLAAELDDEEVVAAGGMLLNADGSLQQSCCNELTLWAVFCEQFGLEKLFPKSPLFSPYWISRRLIHRHGETTQPVHQVMGACLMFRGNELFDERFFLYCEDTELCQRLIRNGKIVYVPHAKFYHELGTSSTLTRWRSVAMYNCGKELYFRIHHGRLAATVCWFLDRLGALLRVAIWFVAIMATSGTRRDYRARASLFWHVFCAPSRYGGLTK